jgi:hypothetical protein
MAASLEERLISAWQQVLIENAKIYPFGMRTILPITPPLPSNS